MTTLERLHPDDIRLLADAIRVARDPQVHSPTISDTKPWYSSYYERKHLYLYSGTAFSFTAEDLGTFSVPANTLVLYPFPQGTRAYSTTAATSYRFLIIATDELLPLLNAQNASNPAIVAGNKTNNNASPGATNMGVLPGIANAAVQTWTEGDQVLESMDLQGNQRTTLGTLIAGENLSTNRLNVEPIYAYNNITTTTTTVCKSGAGTLHAIIVNKATASAVITLFDNNAASGTTIGTITLPATLLDNHFDLVYDVSFSTGLTVLTGTAACDITVAFR